MSVILNEMSDEALDFRDLEDKLSQICDRSEIEQSLKEQLLEIELIQSMFSNPGEFVMDDPHQLMDVNAYINDTSSKLPPRLDFMINLSFDNMKVEVCVNLPHDYPVVEPDIFVRSNKLNRNQQRILNKDANAYIESLRRGETCLYSIISWIQENVDNYTSKEIAEPEEVVIEDEKSFTRLWIYSHHIYSKHKRKEILALAVDFSVTGFMLPGKPGIICVEGESKASAEWWARVRALIWKKIVVKKNETLSLSPGCLHNRFSVFEEISFKHTNNKAAEYHMDMGEFYKYLEKHNSAYIFMDYFGVSGKTNE